MKVYVKIPVERDKVNDKDILLLSGEFYKEIDLSELMEEFADEAASSDYTSEELMKIFNRILTEKGYMTNEQVMTKAINNASKNSFSKTPKQL